MILEIIFVYALGYGNIKLRFWEMKTLSLVGKLSSKNGMVMCLSGC